MSEEILDEIEEVEEPMSANELLANLLKDLVLNEEPDILATDFVEEFVIPGRPEASQILTVLEMPTENLIETVKGLIAESFQAQNQAVDDHGIQYLDGLKAAVRAQMTELAEQ